MNGVLARTVGSLRGLLARPLASYHLLLASAGLLLVVGLTMVFSATSVHALASDGNAFAVLAEQATYAVIGLGAFWVCQRLPVRTLRAVALPLLVAAFALQGTVALIDQLHSLGILDRPAIGSVSAELRWLTVAGVSVQPSELAKIALVLWAADVLAGKGADLGWTRELMLPLAPVAGLLLLVVGHQDLGTMIVLFALLVGMLWAAGVRLRIFVGLGVAGLLGAWLLVLNDADRRMPRLTAFLDPDCDPLTTCYQAVQGRTALADGGWFGVGLGNASHKWGWLPEGHNDFIFAVIGEELGVVGCLVVLALFAVFVYTGLRIARRVADPFRRLVAAGIVSWLLTQTVINIGGVVGLLPITGLPLPFISAGGSALVVTLAAVGILASSARAEPDAARALHARPPARLVQLVWAPLPPLPRSRTRARRPSSDRRESTSAGSQATTDRTGDHT